MTEIVPTFTLGTLDLTAYPYAVEFGADLGAPENAYEVLLTALADGESVASDRVSNREISLTVLVEGASFAELAAAEAALIRETEEARNVLTIDPGDEVGPPTAFDTFRTQATLQRNDDEEQAFLRRYVLTIPALPHGRSVSPSVTSATSSGTETVFIDGSSASGWGIFGFGITTGVVSSGGVLSVNTAANGGAGLLTYTGSTTSLGSDRLIALTWKTTVKGLSSGPNVTLTQGGVQSPNLPESLRSESGGWTTSYYSVPAEISSFERFDVSIIVQGGGSAGTFQIDKVARWDSLPFIGSARQRSVSIITGGSVRTQGSIAVEHASSALGSTIVYTYPSGTGFVPALTPSFFSGPATPTPDGTTISGKRVAINGSGVVYGIPAYRVPEGRAQLWARVRAPSAGTYSIAWSVGNAPTSALAFDAAWNTTGTTTVTLAANTWTLVPLAEAPSQYREVGPLGFVRVGLTQTTGPSTAEVDEAWLFPLDRGALTVLDAGVAAPSTGGSSNRVWVDAPSLDRPQGGLFQGTLTGRDDEHYVTAISSFMDHNFDPAGTTAFVVTSNAQLPTITLTHYRRWHTSAAA